ncbi:hypothetical protein GBF38_006582, partial [Nibea albiflora]
VRVDQCCTAALPPETNCCLDNSRLSSDLQRDDETDGDPSGPQLQIQMNSSQCESTAPTAGGDTQRARAAEGEPGEESEIQATRGD